MIHRTMFCAAALLAAGCIGAESHELLTPSGRSGSAWTVCAREDVPDAAWDGANRDACEFSEGSVCGVRAPSERYPVIQATCLGGGLIRTRWTLSDVAVPDARCASPDVYDWGQPHYVEPAANGCVTAARCEDGVVDEVFEACPDPLEVGLRPGAEEDAPWTGCEGAIQHGTDGDACDGDFLCIGTRSLGEGRASNEIIVRCDGGVLRAYATSPSHL